jgi:hypothetical protein
MNIDDDDDDDFFFLGLTAVVGRDFLIVAHLDTHNTR